MAVEGHVYLWRECIAIKGHVQLGRAIYSSGGL